MCNGNNGLVAFPGISAGSRYRPFLFIINIIIAHSPRAGARPAVSGNTFTSNLRRPAVRSAARPSNPPLSSRATFRVPRSFPFFFSPLPRSSSSDRLLNFLVVDDSVACARRRVADDGDNYFYYYRSVVFFRLSRPRPRPFFHATERFFAERVGTRPVFIFN